MTKFERETRHLLHVCVRKTVNSEKCESTVHAQDAFSPLIRA